MTQREARTRALLISSLNERTSRFQSSFMDDERIPIVSLEEAIQPLIHLIPTVEQYAYTAKRNCRYPADGLSVDESAAILLYDMEWKSGEKSLYVVLEQELRVEPEDYARIKPWFLYLKLLINGLYRLPPVRDIVYRVKLSDVSDQYKTGDIITWFGPSSCTPKLDVLSELFPSSNKRTIFIIKCSSGRKIREHSDFPKEESVFLLPMTRFHVTGTIHQGDLHIIELAEIQWSFV